ncbi:MAG TPA: ABC transporter permease [Syntrophobacteraceae bacterium]|nr:ABC transporter permease [Syntrophobacteraceae bacterium]
MKAFLKFPNDWRWMEPWVLPGLLVLVWAVCGQAGLAPDYLIPRIQEVGKTAWHYVAGGSPGPFAGRFLTDLKASLLRVGGGFALAVVLGIPLGVLSGRFAWVNRGFSNLIHGLRAVPGITWLPLAVVWFGVGMKTTLFLVAMAAFFPIYMNTVEGVRRINPLWIDAGAMLGVTGAGALFRILLPGAMPTIVAGLRLGLGISWAYLVLGELTGVPDGLGAAVMDARMLGRVDMIVVGMILIAVIGRSTDRLLVGMLKCLFKSAGRMSS